MPKEVLEALKAQAEAEIKQLGEQVGRLQYEALLRQSFIKGIDEQLAGLVEEKTE